MSIPAKIIRIGNSKGVRIPKALLAKYSLGDDILLEEHPNGILIHSKSTKQLGWEATYRSMANASKSEAKDWSDWQDLDDGSTF